MFSTDLAPRLGKLIRMLATENDGEALAAARAIARTLEGEDLDLHALAEFVEGGGRSTATSYGPKPTRRPVRPRPSEGVGGEPFNYANAYDQAEPESRLPDHPDGRTRKFGLPAFHPDHVASWAEVAKHCLVLNRTIPKKHGGRFLRGFEIRILEPLARHTGWPTNAQATWIETVVARCHQARSRARNGKEA